MIRNAVTVAFVFAAVSLVGGVLGYVNKGSMPSLIAGGAAGILLALGAWFLARGKWWGAVVILVVSLGLLGRFFAPFLKTHAIWPALVMVVGGAVTAVLAVLALLALRR